MPTTPASLLAKLGKQRLRDLSQHLPDCTLIRAPDQPKPDADNKPRPIRWELRGTLPSSWTRTLDYLWPHSR